MFNQILKEIESAEKLWKRMFPRKQHVIGTNSVASRFIHLFESHGVHRNQIPRFFDHGLTLADIENDANLLPKLTEEILSDACKMFAIRREWLDGAETQIYKHRDYYKHPDEFTTFIETLISNNPDGMLEGVLLAPNTKHHREHAILILEETIGHIGDKEIYRQHICNTSNYKYLEMQCIFNLFYGYFLEKEGLH